VITEMHLKHRDARFFLSIIFFVSGRRRSCEEDVGWHVVGRQ